MKNIQIIDSADNCAYDCFSASEELFTAVFPEDGQDIEFIEDVLERSPVGSLENLFEQMWQRPVAKKDVEGIDGTLFYDLQRKKQYYPNKRESDLNGSGRRSTK